MWFGEEEYGFDVAEVVVHGGDVALVFKVLDRAQATQNEACADAVGKVDGEAVVAHDADAGLVGIEVGYDLHALGGRQQGAFALVEADADDDVVEHGEASAHEGVVAYGEGVERTGEERHTAGRLG